MANDGFEIKKLECFEYDIRVVERHVREGRISWADYQKHLASLPDEADRAQTFKVHLGEDAPSRR